MSVSRSLIAALSAAFVCCSVISCGKSRSIKTLDLPATPVVSESDRFALVLDPYVALRDEPGATGITVAHVRRGEVYSIAGKRLIDEDSSVVIWVNLGKGWCPAASIAFYSSRDKAETAAALFIEQTGQ